MEHPNRPRGAADEITSQQHTQPTAPYEAPAYRPAEAPYQVVTPAACGSGPAPIAGRHTRQIKIAPYPSSRIFIHSLPSMFCPEPSAPTPQK